MIFAQVDDKGLKLLEAELKAAKNAKWYRRLKVIHLSSQGETVPKLAKTFDVSQATIRNYIKRYNDGGLEALKRGNSNGRPPKINLTKEQWEELLRRSPCQFEKLNTGARNWTQKLLVQYCSVYLDVQITVPAISILLKHLGIKWNRGKLKVTSPDPLYMVKRERVETLKVKALSGTLNSHDASPGVRGDADESLPPKPGHLVFFDPTDLHWCPDVGNGYAPKGEQIKVDSPGLENPWCALFGSLSYPTGEGLYTIHERKRHQEVKAHLELLVQRDPDAFWFVVMDNASAHTTPMLDSFREQYRQSMEFVFLPTYSPHLNLIDRLWRLMRGQMTRNQFYQCLIAQCEAVVDWLTKLPFSQFCSLMGINEDDLVFVENRDFAP